MKPLLVVTLLAATAVAALAQQAAPSPNPYGQWTYGLPKDANYFPISVWLQSTRKARQYKEIGINLYIGIYKGPEEADLAAFEEAQMPVICSQNDVALAYVRAKKDKSIIVGWMHGDEPDNAQGIQHWKSAEDIKKAWPEAPDRTLAQWGTYGPPIPPKTIIEDYQKIKQADPTRPVLVNLGQGVAWDKWHGRGIRTNHPEDYLQYVRGCDIVSYDIYPVNATHADVKDKLWLVALGVDRLLEWTRGQKIVWNVIECTQYGKGGRRPAPHEVKAQAWMSLVQGSRGLVYFVHEFAIKNDANEVIRPFTEAGLLRDKEMAQAVGEVNRQIQALAAVLNSPTIADGAAVQSSDAEGPVAAMVKKHGGATYLFAAAMRDKQVKAAFKVAGVEDATAEVLGENRTVPVKGGAFEDAFRGYDVHLYRIK